MMSRDELRGLWAIVEKDMRTYYLKPPAVSWGIIFPITWILAFYLRNPRDFFELLPGLVAMTALFSTTAAEAVVINFELRLGSLERLLLAPVRVYTVFLAKVLGGTLFGLGMSIVVTIGAALGLSASVNVGRLVLVLIPSLLSFSSLGAMLCVLVREVFEAQTLLNLPRFIMIFLSGVVYPTSTMPHALRALSRALPLTYSVEGIRTAFSQTPSTIFYVDALALIGFTAAFVLIGVWRFSARFE